MALYCGCEVVQGYPLCELFLFAFQSGIDKEIDADLSEV